MPWWSVRCRSGSPTCCASRPAFLDFLQGVTGLDVAVYAALLILIVLFMPKGIYGTLRDRFRP